MQTTCEHPPKDPALSGIGAIRLFEYCGQKDLQWLQRYSVTLLSAATSRLTPLFSSRTRRLADPDFPTPMRSGRTLSPSEEAPEDQRATKRQATGQQEGNTGSTSTMADSRNLQALNNAFLDSIQSSPFSSLQYNTMSPALGHGLFETHAAQLESGAPAPDHEPFPANPNADSSAWDMMLGDDFESAALPPLGFPSIDPNLDAPPLPSASTSGSDSTHIDSTAHHHSPNHTIFTQASQSAPSNGTSSMSSVSAFFLGQDPLVISDHERDLKHQGPHRGRSRVANWEKGDTVCFFFGPGALVPAASLLPFSCHRSPKSVEQLAREWTTLSETQFRGKRDPLSLAQLWVTLETIYHRIIIRFATSPSEPGPAIIERIKRAVTTSGVLGVPDLPMKLSELVAWIENDEHGWFSVVHARARNNTLVQERIQERRYRTVRASLTSVASSVPGQSTRSSRQRQPISSLSLSSVPPFNATPPAPSSGMGSALPPNQPEDLGSAMGNVPVVDPNFPPVAEMMRSQQAVNAATIQSALSQASYLRVQAEATRLGMLDQAASVVRKDREQQYRLSLEVLKISDAPTDVRERAGNFIMQFLDDTLPAFNFPELLQQLGMGLPGIGDIANVFLNAPALAPGNAWSIAHAQCSSNVHAAPAPVATPAPAPAPAPSFISDNLPS